MRPDVETIAGRQARPWPWAWKLRSRIMKIVREIMSKGNVKGNLSIPCHLRVANQQVPERWCRCTAFIDTRTKPAHASSGGAGNSLRSGGWLTRCNLAGGTLIHTQAAGSRMTSRHVRLWSSFFCTCARFSCIHASLLPIVDAHIAAEA